MGRRGRAGGLVHIAKIDCNGFDIDIVVVNPVTVITQGHSRPSCFDKKEH
jgi:hypothetical protein